MPRDNWLTVAAARAAHIPFGLFGRRPFTPPQKVVILQPCCISQVMLTTPLLAALSNAYPQTRFDWVVGAWARPAIIGNPRLTELIDAGADNLKAAGWTAIRQLAHRLQEEAYDTCIIPSRSSTLALVAWEASIPQRIGLNVNGRGFTHTIAVKPTAQTKHAAEIYLSLAAHMGVDVGAASSVGMEFYPPDKDRTTVTHRLVEELDWLGDCPLVVIHPGGASNPQQSDPDKVWPAERFARLANHIGRQHGARILLVGTVQDREIAQSIMGMTAVPIANWAGRVSLGELGGLCEVADLYIGNDTGPTHVATAVGCPTLAIFGPSNPAVSGPYGAKGQVVALWHDWQAAGEAGRPFSWDVGVAVEEAVTAVDGLLSQKTAAKR
ncbi:MAG: glycosyltransferase family 9 protein [Chloroflexi bacterium]|nr:glycosyltransferase family 9 protein [Chloroflexota bacterium]